MTLGEQIRQARENKNLSQEELASQLGVSRQAVSKWENDSSVPQGINREMLSQILELELTVSEGASEGKRSIGMWLGWVLAAILFLMLCICVGIGLQLFSFQDGQFSEQWEVENSSTTPAVKYVQFYDSNQSIVGDVALWYNAAEIDSILIQWEGGTPDNIKVFYTPSGTETMEQTELLLTKNILDGDTAALLSADVLKENVQGHVYFELDFGTTIVVSDVYNIFYETDFPESVGSAETLVYIKAVDGRMLTVDVVEWVEIPSSRAAELGLEENDAGFMVYNEEDTMETFTLAEDCVYSVLDWSLNYEPKDVTLEELRDILAEREGIMIPYLLTIEDGQVVAFSERYVP